MRVAFWLGIVSAGIVLAGAVLLLTVKDQMVVNELARPGRTLTDDQIRSAVETNVWLIVGVCLVFTLLAAYFARKMLMGDRKGRRWFTVVTLLLVLFLFAFGGNLISLAGGLFLLVSMAVMFMPTVTRYLLSDSV